MLVSNISNRAYKNPDREKHAHLSTGGGNRVGYPNDEVEIDDARFFTRFPHDHPIYGWSTYPPLTYPP